MLTVLKIPVLLVAFLVLAQQQATVEITSEPSHHQVLQNDWVRVFNVVAAPKATTLVHRHNYDYLFVTLGNTQIINARDGENPVSMALKDGEVRFTKGGFAHAVTNTGETPFHNITIELLQPSTGVHACTADCTVWFPCDATGKGACPSSQILFQSDQWTLASMVFPPGAIYAEHVPLNPHLVVAVSNLDLQQQVKGNAPTGMHRVVGDVGWVKPVVHSLTNTSSAPARIVTLEFKATTPDHNHP